MWEYSLDEFRYRRGSLTRRQPMAVLLCSSAHFGCVSIYMRDREALTRPITRSLRFTMAQIQQQGPELRSTRTAASSAFFKRGNVSEKAVTNWPSFVRYLHPCGRPTRNIIYYNKWTDFSKGCHAPRCRRRALRRGLWHFARITRLMDRTVL